MNTRQKSPGTCALVLRAEKIFRLSVIRWRYVFAMMKTNAISKSANKGRHVTTHRQLTILGNGGILIDNPGLREVGIADGEVGLEVTFNQIIALAQDCKFKDCTHTNETDCGVIAAREISSEELGKLVPKIICRLTKRRRDWRQNQRLIFSFRSTQLVI